MVCGARYDRAFLLRGRPCHMRRGQQLLVHPDVPGRLPGFVGYQFSGISLPAQARGGSLFGR